MDPRELPSASPATVTILNFLVFPIRFVDFKVEFRFRMVSFHSMTWDTWLKFDRGVISLIQSQFFATHSYYSVCSIWYKQQTLSICFFPVSQSRERPHFRAVCYDFEKTTAFMQTNLVLYYIKQIDWTMLLYVFSVIDHRRHQTVVKPSLTHLAIASCATFIFLPYFNIICDLLLNRCTTMWNLFVKQTHKKLVSIS